MGQLDQAESKQQHPSSASHDYVPGGWRRRSAVDSPMTELLEQRAALLAPPMSAFQTARTLASSGSYSADAFPPPHHAAAGAHGPGKARNLGGGFMGGVTAPPSAIQRTHAQQQHQALQHSKQHPSAQHPHSSSFSDHEPLRDSGGSVPSLQAGRYMPTQMGSPDTIMRRLWTKPRQNHANMGSNQQGEAAAGMAPTSFAETKAVASLGGVAHVQSALLSAAAHAAAVEADSVAGLAVDGQPPRSAPTGAQQKRQHLQSQHQQQQQQQQQQASIAPHALKQLESAKEASLRAAIAQAVRSTAVVTNAAAHAHGAGAGHAGGGGRLYHTQPLAHSARLPRSTAAISTQQQKRAQGGGAATARAQQQHRAFGGPVRPQGQSNGNGHVPTLGVVAFGV